MTRFSVYSGFYLPAVIALAFCGPVGRFGLLYAAIYVAAFAALWAMVISFPDWTRQKTFWVVMILGVGLRLAFAWFPHSNDVCRYVWEGVVQNHGFNPYLYAPADPVLAPLRQGAMMDVWETINHKNLSAGYPPVALLFFRLLAAIRPDPVFFKQAILLIDAAVIVPLAWVFKIRGVPFKRLLWYAANPLLLVFIAGEGHLDTIMVFFMCLALACVFTNRCRLGFFFLGCATLTKFFAIPAIFFLIRSDNWKKTVWALLPLVCYLPFLNAGPHLFGTLVTFGANFHYNDILPALLRPFLGSATLGTVLFLFSGMLVFVFLTTHDRLRSTYLAFGCLLVCLPTLHPWYHAIMAPFAAAFASPAWLYLQLGVVATFPVLIGEYQTGVFQEIHWLRWIEVIPFFAMLVWTWLRGRPDSSNRFNRVSTISVVMPVVNEASQLGQSLASLADRPEIIQVVVVDGGSIDGTRNVALEYGAHVLTTGRGRGSQIHAGIEQCHGDIILVMHADCRLASNAGGRIVDMLNKRPFLVGGALGMRFASPGIGKRVLAALNNIRAGVFRISFGDQGQFFRSAVLDQIGGFPDQLLMEDVEMSLRLKTAGRVGFLPRGIVVSGRRWDSQAFFPGVAKVIYLFGRYLIER
ncbi:MAG: glycosyltransferase family 2 protein, partial [Deltaproteobacteria bacterium]|nr:glycosyltransferase family 2 protein [Deltaproteobacteria bacterium]